MFSQFNYGDNMNTNSMPQMPGMGMPGNMGSPAGMQQQPSMAGASYSRQPVMQMSNNSSVSIDDIIGALTVSRDASRDAARQVAAMKQQQQKPIDLNRNDVFYLVCSRVFASGKVWQPVSTMLPEQQMADYEARRLSYTNGNAEYKVFKIKWVLDTDETTAPTSNNTGNKVYAEPHMQPTGSSGSNQQTHQSQSDHKQRPTKTHVEFDKVEDDETTVYK